MEGDQRRFRRVTQRLCLRWRELSVEAAKAEVERLQSCVEDVVDPYIKIQRLCIQFDEIYQGMVESFQAEHRLLAILYQQNQILSAECVEPLIDSLALEPLILLDISAQGCGFYVELQGSASLAEGALIGGTILLSNYVVFSFVGKVASYQKNQETAYVGVLFESVRAHDREALERYLLLAEARERRMSRKAEKNES